MTSSESIGQGLIEAVGERVRPPARRENEGMNERAAFQWGNPIATSKRAALVRARLDEDYAAWRARQQGEPAQADAAGA